MSGTRPTTLLIAAMGGEGGGVLTDWIVAAARAEGLTVQSTSIPGVAQRTGATTYYLELLPAAGRAGAARPVMSLYPGPGDIDVMVATELLEAGRAIQNGYVTPDRTTLIASTHRVYSIGERAAMADGRFDTERVLRAAKELSRQAVLFDMESAARRAGSVINAVILGAIAGSGRLPIRPEAFEDAILGEGKAVDSNLAAFRSGFERAGGGAAVVDLPAAEAKRPFLPAGPTGAGLLARVDVDFPADLRGVLRQGVNRLIDYQDPDYAALYLDRLAPLLVAERQAGGDLGLTREAARHLALWMSYEDVIRVAQAKTRPERLARVRQEVGARPDEPLTVTEFLKPGLDELCSILPPPVARPLVAWAERRGLRDRLNVGLHIRSTSIAGHLLMRGLAGLRSLRRRGYRYAEEQAAIELWLRRLREAAAIDLALAREIAECARLLKGYSDTYRRGRASFAGIMDTLVAPTLRGDMAPKAAAEAIGRARRAALADQQGTALAQALGGAKPPASIQQSASPFETAAVVDPERRAQAHVEGRSPQGEARR